MGETPDDSPCELDLSEAGVVAEIGRIVSSSIEIDEVYELFAEQVAILVPFDGIDIGTYDPKKDTITNVYAGGIEGVPAIPTGEATPLTGALTEEAIRSREARIYCAASEQALLAETPTPPVGMTFGLRSSLVVPLLARGSVFGVLTLRSSQSNAYSERHRRLAERLAGQIGGAIATAWAFAALRESEETWHAVIEASPLAIAALDSGGRVRSWNPAAERLFCWSERELIGHPPPGIPPDRREEMRIGLQRVGRGETIDGFETVRERKDGASIDVVISSAPLFDVKGSVRGVMAVMADISARKRAEAERRQSEEQLRLSFEGAPNGIAIIGLDGRFERENRAFRALLGYAGGELAGMSLTDIAHPGNQGQSRAIVNAVRTGSVPYVEVEQRYVRKDGEPVVVIATIALMRDAAGEPFHLLVQVFDITERRRLEEQLGQSQRLKAIGQLAGGVAHDFNNVLNIIASYCEFLRNELKQGDPRRILVAEIESALARGALLTRQLLAFSRQQVLAPNLVQLNTVVTDLEPVLRVLIGEHIEVVKVLDPGLGRVLVDASQVEQVIMNLAVNARDAMPKGGTLTIETANVELDAAFAGKHVGVQSGPHVMLAVSDTGTGMDPETQAHIFEPFFTTKAPGEGTGLGLSIAYGIVKQSGGSIWSDSEPGVGTTFKVYLPRVARESAAN